MTTLHIISAGAAKGLVEGLAPGFEQQHGIAARGQFGAVGAMKEALMAGDACDVLILTQKLLEDLARDGRIDGTSIRPLGRVYTGVAVPEGAPTPAIDDEAALRASIEAATAIYLPDPVRATAGIHFAAVLDRLGIRQQVQARLRAYPNGATAMAEMARAGDLRALGCTQATEILYTRGVRLVGLLPKAFELATIYSAAVAMGAANASAAAAFVDALAAPANAALRKSGGFEPA